MVLVMNGNYKQDLLIGNCSAEAPDFLRSEKLIFKYLKMYIVTRGTWYVVGWGTMLQAERSRVRFSMMLLDFKSFQQHYSSGVDAASSRNEYQESS
jgi:hypothetical protein